VAIETMIHSLVENINKAQQMSEEARVKAEEAEEAGKRHRKLFVLPKAQNRKECLPLPPIFKMWWP
jgi:hypothetical protein